MLYRIIFMSLLSKIYQTKGRPALSSLNREAFNIIVNFLRRVILNVSCMLFYLVFSLFKVENFPLNLICGDNLLPRSGIQQLVSNHYLEFLVFIFPDFHRMSYKHGIRPVYSLRALLKTILKPCSIIKFYV